MEFNTRLRVEIFKNIFWGATVFDSFDSQPPAIGVERNDFGVVTTLGFTFNR
jgi:hypothetical protein